MKRKLNKSLKLIQERAKKIYKGKEKEKYSDAIKRATKELKKEGKL